MSVHREALLTRISNATANPKNRQQTRAKKECYAGGARTEIKMGAEVLICSDGVGREDSTVSGSGIDGGGVIWPDLPVVTHWQEIHAVVQFRLGTSSCKMTERHVCTRETAVLK